MLLLFSIYRCLGLSLIEILIALSIVIILTVATVPTFINLYQEHHLKSYIQNLNYVLQYARSEAIKNNQTVYVNFQTGDNWCYGINAGTNCSCNVATSCGLGTYVAPRSQDLSLSTSGLSNQSLTFEGTHGATNTSSTLTFSLYGKTSSITIKITALGNLQYCSSTYSEYPTCS